MKKLCLFLCVLGLFAVVSGNGGCGGGGGGGDTFPPRPEPQGNWQDEGNYDTGWYSNTPYEISTAQELAGLAKLVNDGTTFEGETISVTGDIDLQDHYWTPISNHNFATPFRGTFDGRGNTMSNIAISIEEIDGQAMIGFVGTNDGTITNVHLTNISISGANDGLVFAGGLVGWNRGTVIDCTVYRSDISASGYLCDIGGLVGSNDGAITGCKVITPTLSASDPSSNPMASAQAGGLAGQTGGDGATITDCVVSGGKVITIPTNGRSNAGGFLGLFAGGTLSGNTTTTTGLPAIGCDGRLDPPGPSDNI